MTNKRNSLVFTLILIILLIMFMAGCEDKNQEVTIDIVQSSIGNDVTIVVNDKEIEPIQETDDGINVSETMHEKGNTTFNLKNGGIFMQKDDWIIYSYELKEETYKVKVDGSEKVLLFNHYITNINVVGDWIYYLKEEGTILKEKLYKTKLDGSETQLLSEDFCDEVIINGEWIYYVNESDRYKLYRMNLNGTEKQKIYDGIVGSYDVCGDIIFFTRTSPSAFYKMKDDGTDIIKLSDDYFLNICVYKDRVYFLDSDDEKRLYSIKMDGTEKSKISDERIYRFNVSDGWIYYIDELNWNINKVKIDGTGSIKLNNDKSDDLHIFNGWIFYNIDGGLGEGVSYYEPFMMKLDGSEEKGLNFLCEQ